MESSIPLGIKKNKRSYQTLGRIIIRGEERPLGHFFSYFLPTGNSKVFNCLSKPDVKSVANKSVTDRDLLDSRKILEAVKILEV
jgi:hypothetical protein